MTVPNAETEVVVVGAGPVGLMAAVALAAGGVPTTLVARRAPQDNRTTALLAGSVAALSVLEVWPLCEAQSAPLRVMRLADDTGRLLRAPEARFEAAEIGIEAFGYNIENRHLLAALEARARDLPFLTWIEDEVERIDADGGGLAIALKGGDRIGARLAIGADGRNSLCRAAAGISMRGWSYPQVALTFNVAHTRPHGDTSTEFHTRSGPFTLVPLPGRRSSIVCVVDPEAAERMSGLDSAALAEELERRSHSILGRITVEPDRGRFPLAAQTARPFAAKRIALVGEAAHVIPPIGAQGLNLGLRDAAAIGELVIAARASGADPGGEDVLARYEALRRADVESRTFAVDVLNRTLLSGFLPLQGVRGLGFALMNRIGPLRRAAMREGVAPSGQPDLMRGAGLERDATLH